MIQYLDSLTDPRLDPYRKLKERELARDGQRFIAEGHNLVRRLLDSDFPTESVLLSTRRVDAFASNIPDDVPLYILGDDLIHQVIGYRFHSGVIACGRRKPPLPLNVLIPPSPNPAMVVVCPEIANTENLGAMIRISAAFGASAMILGPRSCDPFFRQSIRVSMGTVFRLPIHHSDDLAVDLKRLREEHAMRIFATVLDENAIRLSDVKPPDRSILMFGNEAQGLEARWIEQADQSLTIPMGLGTDSLNVSVAAAVFLYHFTRR